MNYALFLPLLLALQAPTQSVAQAAPPAPTADNCEPIRQQIEARFRAGGVQPVLVVVDAGSAAGGRIVGTCGSGRRQIVRLSQVPMAAAAIPAERRPDGSAGRTADQAGERAAERGPADKIPTECRDGSIVIGPNCDDPRAVRMTSAELAASLPPARPAAADPPAASASGEEPAKAASR